jgi:hypothetical protein
VIGNIDDHKGLEIIGLDEFGVLYVWKPDGNEYRDGDSSPSTPGVFRRFTGCTLQYGSPAIADIDKDGRNEIVVGTQGDSLYVLNEDGTSVAGWPVYLGSDAGGSVVVGDLDADGGGDLEIVFNTYNGDVKAFHHDGTELWSQWYPNSLPFGPSPALADLDGGGDLEVVIPSANGNVYAIKANGTQVSGWPVQYSASTYSESSPIIADVDADGSLDVLLGDETKLINAWDVSGNLLDGFPLATRDAMRGVPAVTDIDDDGDVDIIAAGWDSYVYVWDLESAYDEDDVPWGSFQSNRHNDGRSGSILPTGIADVAFTFEALGSGGVSLTWSLPASSVYGRFDLSRAEVSEGGMPGEFGVVASGRSVGLDGTLRYVDKGALAGERYVYQLKSTDSGTLVYTTGEIYVPVTAGSLSQNYPNPFNPTTQITYYLPEGGVRRVSLVVYDVRGARVRTLVDATSTGGKYTVEWDGRNDHGQSVGSGVYFYRLVGQNYTRNKKMLLLK